MNVQPPMDTIAHMPDSMIDRIDERLAALGMTRSAASIAAGLNAHAIRAIAEGRSRNPRRDTIEKLATVLNCSTEWLMFGDPNGGAGSSTHRHLAEDQATFRPANQGPALPPRETMPKDVPVLGTAAGSDDGAIQMGAGEIDTVRRPPGLRNARDLYAVYVEGDSMEPRYSAGDLVYVSPHKPVRIGDDVVVQVASGDGQDIEIVDYVKKLKTRRGEHWVFEQFNPPSENIRWDGRVKDVHRIYRVNEIFGV